MSSGSSASGDKEAPPPADCRLSLNILPSTVGLPCISAGGKLVRFIIICIFNLRYFRPRVFFKRVSHRQHKHRYIIHRLFFLFFIIRVVKDPLVHRKVINTLDNDEVTVCSSCLLLSPSELQAVKHRVLPIWPCTSVAPLPIFRIANL